MREEHKAPAAPCRPQRRLRRRTPPRSRLADARPRDLPRAGHRRSRRGARAGPPLCRAIRHQGAAGGDLSPQGGLEFAAAVESRPRPRRRLRAAPRPHACQAPRRRSAGLRPAAVRARVTRGLPILQWLRPDIDPATVSDPQHASLLSGENVMRIGLEAFKADILKRAEKRPPPRAALRAVHLHQCRRQRHQDRRGSAPRVHQRACQRRGADPAGLVGGRAARPRREHRRVRRAGHGLRRDDAGLGARPASPLFEAEAPPQAAR